MVKIGMLIADRYEILEKVGCGGMSDVYKAKDHKLNRLVAIKVLKQEFSENASFVSKFRVEAQAAAGLMHPNIVNVYDVGEEKGVYFIVMELVDGITLKKYIETRQGLPVQEAVTIAIQVAMGLEAAHRNHIIHRDIKPQNIIISKEGKVKVTDFGIAKIATSNTITSNVMGSVHYTSPEQARGGYSDEKSDIYSLGITLFEMLTGKVPYTGETTVAIAIRHIQDPMPSPRQYVRDLPYSVEQIVMKCCEKSPDRRYQNTAELIADLKRSLMDPDGDFVKRFSPDDLGSTRAITPEERQTIKQAAGRVASGEIEPVTDDTLLGEVVKPPRQEEELFEEDDPETEIERELEEEEDDNRTERLTAIISILAAIIIGLVIIIVAAGRMGIIQLGGNNSQAGATTVNGVRMVTVPELLGLEETVACRNLTDAGLKYKVIYVENSEYEAGTVTDASEKEGSEIPEGSIVTLTVSGSKGIEVPDVLGYQRDEAIEILETAGLYVSVKEVASAEVETGLVIGQDPAAGTRISTGSTVELTVSSGPDLSGKVQMVDLRGMSEEAAEELLIAMGLKVGTIGFEVTDDEEEVGIVLDQTVEEGTYVDAGTEIGLTVGKQMTYSYNVNISQPSYDYEEGTMVHIVVSTDSGQVLLTTDTDSFPYVEGRITEIPEGAGSVTLTWSYTYYEEEEVTIPVEGEDSGEGGTEPASESSGTTTTIVVNEVTEEREETRDLEFQKEY